MPVARDEGLFDRVVTSAFGQRRKKLTNSVPAGVDATGEDVSTALRELGLKASARAEELSPADFVLLTNSLAAR
jgi:16S rRNA (adenine1518-N6/adenine1519-N6)-dimethyltransferase